MTPSSTPLRLIVISQRDQEGWTTATIAAVLGTISMGPNRREARDNGFDALREMLAAPVNVPDGAAIEDVDFTLELAHSQSRGHER